MSVHMIWGYHTKVSLILPEGVKQSVSHDTHGSHISVHGVADILLFPRVRNLGPQQIPFKFSYSVLACKINNANSFIADQLVQL